jgi:dTDP-4-dehydrorhamnose reductase
MINYLIIGGDSFVGKSVISSLQNSGNKVYSTTRRNENLSFNKFFLDYTDQSYKKIPEFIDYIYIIASTTPIEECESELANLISKVYIPKLAEFFISKGKYITFISSNAVFDGDKPWPEEDDQPTPNITYGIQKKESEDRLFDIADKYNAIKKLSIVRITKVLSIITPPIPNWLTMWELKKSVYPFLDLIFAPISLQFVGKSLAFIGQNLLFGKFHLSGSNNISYVDLAKAIAEKKGINLDLIKPTFSYNEGIKLYFKPVYSGLSMKNTTKATGIAPQTLKNVVSDIFNFV